MDSYDEQEFKRFMEFMERMQADLEVRQLEGLEVALADTPSETKPMPNTCHPAYYSRADSVRRMLFEDRYNTGTIRGAIKVPDTRPAPTYEEAALYPQSITSHHILLERKKFYGPAPFIGDPRLERAAYFWSAWIDKYGRWISEDATLVYGPR